MKQALADQALIAFQEAAFLPDRWQDALRALADSAASNVALMQMVGNDSYDLVASGGVDPEWSRQYIAEGWHENNPRLQRGMALTMRGVRGLITERQMLSEEELATHPFQQDFSRRYGTTHEAGILLARHAGSNFILTVQRDEGKGPYTDDELRFLNALVARLANASDLAVRLKLDHAVATADMIAAKAGAVALLGGGGFAFFHNADFERLLGDVLTLRQGRIAATDHDSDRRLQHVIEACSRGGDGPAMFEPVVLRRLAGRPVLARAHPLAGAARDFFGLAATILTFDDLAAPPLPAPVSLLVEAFGLTPAEARLARRVGAALTLREAADAERISYETARTRLKTIFDKTGTASQTELAMLVGRLA